MDEQTCNLHFNGRVFSRVWSRLALPGGACTIGVRALSLLFLASLLLSFFPPPRVSAQAPIRVEWKQGLLRVDAENASLSEVLGRVASQTGVRFLGLETLHSRISQHFSDLSLSQGLQLLLTDVDYAVSGDLSRPATIRVLVLERMAIARDSDAATTPLKKARPEDKARTPPGQNATQDKNIIQEQEAALHRDILSADPTTQVTAFETLYLWDHEKAVDALLDAAKSANSGTRFQALQLLVGARYADPGTTLSLLHDALNDEDETVRGFAIQSLANQGGKQAMDYLRETLRDPDPGIRLTIISSVAQKPEGRALLRAAVSDPDESVSSTAAFLLQQAEKQGK